MPDLMTSSPTSGPGGRIAAVLAGCYGLTVCTITQLPIGQGTVNYRANCNGRQVFVKSYPDGTDLPAEREAIALAGLALQAGIPGAVVLPNEDGDVIDTSSPLAMSVWEWVPGQVITHLSPAQLAAAGTALGRIHALFADRPAPAAAPAVKQWRGIDVDGLAVTIDQLLDIIAERVRTGVADPFDGDAQRTLLERRAMLARIPVLLADLPTDLTVQVLHGDYSPVNLLFTGDELSAVLDFRPPEPFLLAYDLGRMAFYPNTVTEGGNWLDAAATLIGAYQEAHPAVPDVDVRACGRVALLQLLKSLYGVKQHYLKPGLFQDDLDDFWLIRHRAAATLLSELAGTDTLLAELAGT
ncbi:phosphotransferase [Streptosporangium sp. NBC_01755]|uniref:phosphotransferase enzyme family protein n=1 Tax=Streptosporangium sp. NBC_01755 TaxID=2975949 RepID=UPI002DDB1DEF|nr:phosphotransferase [Streptosporangium sp. NBC_01755]WSD02511.1 phosphotransferase [Streptosporangium sp. NBC_01755]